MGIKFFPSGKAWENEYDGDNPSVSSDMMRLLNRTIAENETLAGDSADNLAT